MRTVTDDFTLSEGALGLCGESGEVTEIIKKHFYHGHKLDRDNLLLELGDVAWYLAVIAELCGIELSEVFEANIEKLQKRYPDGFSSERSINR